MLKYMSLLSLCLTACGQALYTEHFGRDGGDGKDGHSSLIMVLDTSTCVAGGKTIVSYKDMDDNGFLNMEKDKNIQTMQVCNGVAGSNGTNGSNGADGATGAKGDKGDKGDAGNNGVDGTNGTNGSNGSNGSNGTNGSNGSDGATGAKGDKGDKGDTGNPGVTPSFTPVDYVQPCGPTVPYKEVLLVLFDGSILGSFSDNASGLNTRFAFIPDGSYIDTDGSNCNFTVTHTAHTRTVSWSGGSKTWSF